MYHDTAQLVWEGNPVQGKDNIEKFLQVSLICKFLSKNVKLINQNVS